MAEQDDTKIDVIPNDAIITISLSGAFYAKLQHALFILMDEKKDPALVGRLMKELDSRDPQDFWELQLTIYLALLYAIETEAAKQGHIKKDDASKYIPNDDSSPEASPES